MNIQEEIIKAMPGVILGGVLGVFSSLIASCVFWYYSFKKVRAKIHFTDYVQISDNTTGGYPGTYRCRLKLANMGKYDFFDVSITAKVMVGLNTTYIGVNKPYVNVLNGTKMQKKYPDKTFMHFLRFYINEQSMTEYSKKIYYSSIRKKAKNKRLSLYDIINAYPNATLQVFIMGNDKVTGARKLFISKRYTKTHFARGRFRKGSLEFDVESSEDIDIEQTNNDIEESESPRDPEKPSI